MNTNTEPKIRINGMSLVSIDPIESIADISTICGRFARLVDADAPGATLKLSTAVGDLAASVSQNLDNDDVVEEVADVLIATLTLAATRGIDADAVKATVRRRLGEQSTDAVRAMMANSLNARGFGQQ